ncbi:MAG: DUF1761 domain-containing protein [Gammaproteobacteria bacterium]|nr:DUF1761 domain-containing protein [Gammaproteobacteria bacterium]MDE2346297.1 DUF1761 domain-containing protein [Gammaproteobacteria bacterium]
MLAQINYLAVVLAGLGGFMVGAVWYLPFTFGPLWLKANPHLLQEIESGGRWQRYLVALVCSILQAFVLALCLAFMGRDAGLGTALAAGVLLWLGFTAAPSLVDTLISRRSTAAWMLDTGHRLLAILVMAFLLMAITGMSA